MPEVIPPFRSSVSERTACVAVVGTGSAGMQHLKALQVMEGVLPVALPLRANRAPVFQGSGIEVVSSVKEAAVFGARFCIVATDTGRHCKDALAALEEGMDLLVEKPLAPDEEQARTLLNAFTQAGRKGYVGYLLRFSQSLLAFRQKLPEVGRLHSVEIACQSYLPDWRPFRPYRDSYSASKEEGGVLRDLIHEIDYAGWLFGWPRRLQARLFNRGRLGIASEEMALLNWEIPAGGFLTIVLDYLSRPSRRRMRVSGDRGAMEWDGIAQTLTLELAGEPAQTERFPQSSREMFEAQARAFLSSCRGEPDPRLATFEEGVKAVAICDAARRASSARQEERVEDGNG